MMLACLLIASAAAMPVVPRDIHADAAPLLAATRGLVRDADPALGYDLQGLAAYEPGAARMPVRLGYAGFDQPGRGREWREVTTAHQTAADIVRDGGALAPGERR